MPSVVVKPLLASRRGGAGVVVQGAKVLAGSLAAVVVGSVVSFAALGTSYAGVESDSLASALVKTYGGSFRRLAIVLAASAAIETIACALVAFGVAICLFSSNRKRARSWRLHLATGALVVFAYVGAIAHRHPGLYLTALSGSRLLSVGATLSAWVFPLLAAVSIVGYVRAIMRGRLASRVGAVALTFGACFGFVYATQGLPPIEPYGPRPAPIDPWPAAKKPPPSVLLIAIDSLRSDHLDAAHTPNLKAFIDDSVYFPNCLVTEPRTGPSWAAILTSMPPLENGVETMFPSEKRRHLAKIALPAQLATEGYRTAVYSEYAGEFFERIDAGYAQKSVPRVELEEIVEQSLLLRQPIALAAIAQAYTFGPRTREMLGEPLRSLLRGMVSFSHPLELGEDFLATEDEARARNDHAPFFTTIFYSQPHFPYAASSPYYDRYRVSGSSPTLAYGHDVTNESPITTDADRQQIDGLYRGALAETDDAVGRLVAGLKERGMWDDAIVILTADHGEGLFECADCVGHGDNLHGLGTLRVPLAIHLPKARFSAAIPAERAEYVSQLDVYPTVLAALGIDPVVTHEGLALVGADGRVNVPPLRTLFAETGEWLWNTAAVPSPRIMYPPLTTMATLEGEHIVIDDTYVPEIRAAKHRAAIRYPYKLSYKPEPGGVRWQLFDIAADPLEQRDLASEKPVVFEELKQALRLSVLRFAFMLPVDDFFLTRQELPPEEAYWAPTRPAR